MLLTGSPSVDAQRAFDRASRARRRAALRERLRGRACGCGERPRRRGCGCPAGRLPVLEPRALTPPRGLTAGVREIALDEIRGTLEPGRAHLFDGAFRPAPAARGRWLSVWLAEHRGVVLPPVAVVRVGHAYAVRDGHHRISVARARGAVTIDATIEHLPS
jgi:hypothetical protein